jgi:O-antigen ligase
MPSQERVPAGIGCLSTVVGLVVLVGVVVLVFFVGFIALAVVAALVVVGLVVWAVDRLLLALSPKRRARREAAQRAVIWRFGGMSTGAGPFGGTVPGEVIDTTASDTPADPNDKWSTGDEPDQLGPA